MRSKRTELELQFFEKKLLFFAFVGIFSVISVSHFVHQVFVLLWLAF